MICHEQLTIKWRRYGHWDTSARKAWLCAFALWELTNEDKLAALTQISGYDLGDEDHAIIQGFYRESAVALELIIKAVLAKQLELHDGTPADRVPATHDIPTLWLDAKLPEQGRDNKYRLLLYKSILLWAGRYSTPRSAKAWAAENQEFRDLNPPEEDHVFVFRPVVRIGWTEFDNLYQLAALRLTDLQRVTMTGQVLQG